MPMQDSGIFPKSEFDLVEVFKGIMETLDKDVGAVLTFLGVARNTGLKGKVSKVEMESYERHANKVLKQICHEVEQKYEDVRFVRIFHFVGEFDVGDAMVMAIAGSAHRDQAFKALREAVERYKTEPALFKKEVYLDGSHTWVSHA